MKIVQIVTFIAESFRRQTIALVVSTFILILLGGYVKAIHAGLACPDWPLCYGKFIPALSDSKIFAEWFHRLWAMLNGFYMLFIAYRAYGYRYQVPAIFRFSMILLVLYASQVILGGLTVTSSLEASIVTAHLGNAVLIIILQMIIVFYATVNTENFILSTQNFANSLEMRNEATMSSLPNEKESCDGQNFYAGQTDQFYHNLGNVC